MLFWIDGKTRNELIKEDRNSEFLIKPLCRGTDIRKWRLLKNDLYIIYTHSNINIEDFPAIKNYLEKFKNKLESRAVKQPWWQLQQAQNKEGIWESRKILYPDICKESRFLIDESSTYSDMKGFVINSSSNYLLSILNSKLLWWYLKQICAVLGDPNNGGRLQLKRQYVENIPLKIISISLQQPFIDKVDQILSLKKVNPEADTSALEREIDFMVYALYGLSEEEIKIVEES